MRMRFWLCGVLALAGAACEKEPTRPVVVAVASVTVQPDSVSLQVGNTAQLAATLRDAAGAELTGRAVTWSSSDQSRATVSPTGLVTAVAAGRVIVSAVSEGKRDSSIVNVSTQPALDYVLADAQFTQAVQSLDGSIPMVLGGKPAAVNVLISSTRQNDTTRLQVVLRLYNANGTLVRTDTALSGRMVTGTSYAAPNVQFLVPGASLTAGMQWQVEVDPRQQVADANRANNIFPRTGRRTQATTTVPAFKVRLVPMVLSAHNNATLTVTANQLPEYFSKLLAVHPLAGVTATIGSALSTSANFGTPPSGGQASFWQQVLADLDLARMTSQLDPETHWYGLVRPPAGFNFTTFGGFSYIPSSGTATGASTRTSSGVGLGWFNNPAQSRELVAHELAHSFGRRHAPCGDASNTDPLFPNPNGTIGIVAHDVFSWAAGTSSSAPVIDPGVGDIMGYCFPTWISEYTYRGVLAFRGPGIAAAVASQPAARTNVLIVRGHITNGSMIQFDPTFTLEGRPSLPERAGRYMLEGRAADGRLLFAHNFEPAELDHAPHLRPFAFALQLSPADQEALHTIEVRGPAVAARVERPARSALRPQTAQRINLQRSGNTVTVRCPDASARGIAVLDSNGELLATARAPYLSLTAAPSSRLTIACSDGVHTAGFTN